MTDRTPTSDPVALPQTEAGRVLDEDAVRVWYQPDDPSAPYHDPRSHSQSATADVRAAILAIEAEARAAFAAQVAAAALARGINPAALLLAASPEPAIEEAIRQQARAAFAAQPLSENDALRVLEGLGHKPTGDGNLCLHRWRNRTTRAVHCPFLAGWRAAEVAAASPEPASPEAPGSGLREAAHRMGPPRWEPGNAQDEWTNRCLACGERWPCAARPDDAE